jgi:hypothetical protein
MLSRPTVFALLGLVPLVNGCAAGDLAEGRPLRPNFITSGFVDQSATYGNVGAFIIQRASDGHIFPICSGTLIAPTVFLTAAHCTALYESEFAPQGFTAAVSFDSPIAFGDLTNLPGTSLIPAAQVVTNPGFRRAQDDSGDLGVLLLPPNRTQGITPAVLPTLGLLDRLAALGGLRNAVFTAVGYGVQDRVVGGGVPFFQDLNPIPRMFAFGSFIALNPGYLRLSQNPTRGSGGTCFGDSGGPNFLDLNGTRVLVATTVTGDAVCRATNVDYRLDIASARAFLGRFVTLP